MAGQGGFGVDLKVTTTGLTSVVHILEIEFPELEKILADVTAHDSPGGWDEVIDTGKRVSNEFVAKLLWDADDPTHGAIVDNFDGTAAMAMSIEDPDGVEVITFNAYVQKMGRVAEQEEGYVCEVTIKPTGAITITNAV